MRVGRAVALGGEDDDWLVFVVVLGGDDWAVLAMLAPQQPTLAPRS